MMAEGDVSLERGWAIARELVSEHGMMFRVTLRRGHDVEACFQLGGRSWCRTATADRPGTAIATAALAAAGVTDSPEA